MNPIDRRALLKAMSGAALPTLGGFLPLAAGAQGRYPNKPITLIVPQPAGGDADAVCRTLQAKMQELLGQPVIIDNRGGAAGNIGTALGAKAAPDGYTVTFVNQGTMVFNPHLYPNPGFKLDQFEPVTQLASIDLVICANPGVPANTLKELLELARKEPGRFTYGTAGSGSANHMAGEMLKAMAKVDLTHVPYRGGGPAIVGTLGGETNLVLAFPLGALPHIRAGKLKALAVTGSKRSKVLPNVPTVAESGVKGYEFASWFGLVVPKRTPQEVISRLNFAATGALKTPEISERLQSGMTEPVGSSPQDFGRLIAQESARWAKLIKQFNMKID